MKPLLLIAALGACAPLGAYAGKTTQGVKVYVQEDVTNEVHLEDISILVENAIVVHSQHWGTDEDKIRKHARKWRLILKHGTECPTNSQYTVCGGYAYQRRMYVTWRNLKRGDEGVADVEGPFCAAATAVAHEANHLMMGRFQGDSDPTHSRDWHIIRAADTLSGRKLCPWLYEEHTP